MSEGGGGGKPLHNAAEVQQTGKRSFSGVWLRLPICWRFSTRRHASVDKPDTPRTSSQYDTFLWQIDARPRRVGLGFDAMPPALASAPRGDRAGGHLPSHLPKN